MIEKIIINDRRNENYFTSDPRDGFLVCLPEKCSLDDFLQSARVRPNSYASLLISRLYHELVTISENVIDEYENFYSKEYKDLSAFLFWKYCVPKNTSGKILSQIQQGEVVRFGKFSSGCSGTADTFMENEIMLKSLEKMIQDVRRKYHENS